MSTNDNISTGKQNEVHEEYDELSKIKILGGHDFDGIKELDNRLPPWLKYLFYVSIVFSFAYLVRLVIFEDDSIVQSLEYENEMAAANPETEAIADSIVPEVKIVSMEEKLSKGKATYNSVCAVCHGKFGEGLVGPNLTDDYWIHGGSIEELSAVIADGIIEKGMLAFKTQLSPTQREYVLDYILSLEGTNPANAKAPEGEKFVRN